MSDILRLHNDVENVLKGWERSTPIAGNLINSIPDTLTGGAVLRKMGTSIPSPFARIFLFDAAFKMIQGAHNGNTPYHQLVSECLDFIEFLYLRSNDSLLTVKKWDKVDELSNLAGSPISQHQNLATTLQQHLTTDFPTLQEIFLFFYDGVLIGGTSPLTMVFTSPNWVRKMNQKGWNFSGGIAGQALFAGMSIPLHKRSADFREYLQKFRLAYNIVINQQSPCLFNYLQTSYNNYDRDIAASFATAGLAAGFDSHTFLTEYPQVSMPDGTIITSQMLPLCHKSTVIKNFASGYMICPTNLQCTSYMWDGVNIPIKTPLALTDAGLPNIPYLGGQPWDSHTCTLQRFPMQPLHERVLPGGAGITYPYLTDADFLQDTLIRVEYTIANDKFVTCYNGESHYLLPIKKEYFRFFKLENLEKYLHLTIEGNKVVAKLEIPITDSNYRHITFKKEYIEGENIIECDNANNYFNLGITPFYTVIDDTELNNYCIMLGDTTKQVSLSFYNFDSVDTSIQTGQETERTNISKYIHIQSFDYIQLSLGQEKALIIPKMKRIEAVKGNKDYSFCVDFGTTNTHIAYSTDNGATSQTFTITEQDGQVAYLNCLNLQDGNYGEKYWSTFRSGAFAASSDREFAPVLIGNKSHISYPFRTAVCETSAFNNGIPMNLFGNISLGFLMQRELYQLDGNEYRTDLKWALENRQGNLTACENRVKAYCRQIVWMIKNKVLLNSGKPAFTLVLTFPGTMSRNVKNTYIGFWTSACNALLSGVTIQIYEESESVVPYYSFVKAAITNVADAVNVDIGGGTTDMLFVQNKKKMQYYTSSLFAANDLWGDGLGSVAFAQKNNGYIKLVDNALENGNITLSKSNLRQYYDTYKGIAQSSADIVSFLFKNDEEFKLSNLIMNDGKYVLVFIHFSAILYHISQVAKKIGMGIPTYLTFTGMGSNLIKLISNKESDIRDLAKLFLEIFFEEQAPQLFTVKFAENPKEITAEGALASLHPAMEKIHPELIKVYGFKDAEDNYEFKDAMHQKTEILNEFNKFITLLSTNPSIKNYLYNNYKVRISTDIADELRKYAGLSYDMMAHRSLDPEAPINETLFFWPLKQVLYELTKQL